MDNAQDAWLWLMAASAIIWLGLAAYLGFLGIAQRNLRRRCSQLEMMANERDI